MVQFDCLWQPPMELSTLQVTMVVFIRWMLPRADCFGDFVVHLSITLRSGTVA